MVKGFKCDPPFTIFSVLQLLETCYIGNVLNIDVISLGNPGVIHAVGTEWFTPWLPRMRYYTLRIINVGYMAFSTAH